MCTLCAKTHACVKKTPKQTEGGPKDTEGGSKPGENAPSESTPLGSALAALTDGM